MRDKRMEEKFNELTTLWIEMDNIEKVRFAHDIVEFRETECFMHIMQLMCNVSNVRTYKTIIALLENWANMDEVEKEYITSRLFKGNSKDFQAFVDMIYKAVEFVADIDAKVENCTMDVEVKDQNEFGKSDLLGVPDNDYLDRIKARREQIYREIRELSGNNIPAQLKALQERLRDNCEAMKAVLEV